ncbi:TetR/AcrR family transcriptional regulator C-terminal domain-containing protein [Streptomyces drozdowiczii]
MFSDYERHFEESLELVISGIAAAHRLD